MPNDTSSFTKGRLVVLAGPSAVGKSSVVAKVRQQLPDLYFSVSATTRDPRPGEVHGRDYRFVEASEFDRMIANGELLEWAEIHRGLHRSGTPAGPVRDAISTGEPVLLEVDLQGARAIRTAAPEALLVFLAPPSWEVLVDRLTGRGTEPAAVIERRLEDQLRAGVRVQFVLETVEDEPEDGKEEEQSDDPGHDAQQEGDGTVLADRKSVV